MKAATQSIDLGSATESGRIARHQDEYEYRIYAAVGWVVVLPWVAMRRLFGRSHPPVSMRVEARERVQNILGMVFMA